MGKHLIVSALSAGGLLAALGAAWALGSPPGPSVAVRLPKAENAVSVPLGAFEGGAILEVRLDRIVIDGEELPLAEEPRKHPEKNAAHSALTDALSRRRQAMVERQLAGQGPPFTGDLLLAVDAEVPARFVTSVLYSATQAGFNTAYFLVSDESAPAPGPRLAARPGGQFLNALVEPGARVRLTPWQSNPSPRSGERARLAALVDEQAGDEGPVDCALLAHESTVSWSDVVATSDELAGLGVEVILGSTSGDAAAPLPPAPLFSARTYLGERVPVLQAYVPVHGAPRDGRCTSALKGGGIHESASEAEE